MPPAAKRARRSTSSPSKSPTKRASASKKAASSSSARASGASRQSPRRKNQERSHAGRPEDSDDEEDGNDEMIDDESDLAAPGTSYITTSSGDAYLMYSASPSKTSDALLSNEIDPAFTIASFKAALEANDSQPGLAAQRKSLEARSQAFKGRRETDKWLWEMQQGFNILLHGFGSKRHVANAFAEKARSKGHVIVVNGYDPSSNLSDVILALEEVVKEEWRAAERDASRKQNGSHTRKDKGKGKATADPDPVPAGRSKPPILLAPSLSALESRTRRFIRSLAEAPATIAPIYLVIHSLDSATLRPPKTMSLLALLAAQPGIHLLATVDHVRAMLLFPTNMAVTRPPHMSRPSRQSSSGSSGGSDVRQIPDDDPQTHEDTLQSIRTFSFIPYSTPTLLPYTTEFLHASTLSHLLPPTIFPSALDATLNGGDAGGGSGSTTGSMTQSTLHVLASVTDRAKRVFVRLARGQVESFQALAESERKRVAVTGPMARDGVAAPVVATSLDSFKAICTDSLLAAHTDQVDGLLAEFRDHGVVRGTLVPPPIDDHDGGQAEADGQDGHGDGGEWIWIALGLQALLEVLEEVGGEEEEY